MTWWYYCEIMPCLIWDQAPHRRHPEHLDTGAASQWPAAARIVSGSGYLAAASSHPHYKYTASDHDINQIRRVNNNGDRCRKLESVLSLSSQFTYFPDTWPRLSDTSWHWGTEGSRDLRWWDNQHRSVLPWSCRRTLSRLWTLNIELRVLILFYYLHTHLPTSEAGIQTRENWAR